ncbi:MAG TPA: peptide deformylase [Candidatus Saccharimonadales bacterium]|nr:peptide deformylase [Candidatus Saccharimonadales bacterium]
MIDLVEPTNQLLNQKANIVLVDDITLPDVQDTIRRMIQLSAGKGHDDEDTRQMVGLAAVQLGINKQIITIDLSADGSNKEQKLQAIINPKITSYSDEKVNGREGCWSCGDICGAVMRSKDVVLEGLDQTGKPITLHLMGFVARIAQHEVDHLHGIRFPDRIPLDQPGRLHLVKPSEFEEYRKNWRDWSVLCPREKWEEMRSGVMVN